MRWPFIRVWQSAIPLALIICTSAAAIAGGQQVRIEMRDGVPVVVSTLPLPVAVLLASRSTSGTLDHWEVLRVGANGTAAVESNGAQLPKIERVEALSVSVSLRSASPTCERSSGASDSEKRARLENQLEELKVSQSPEALALISAASALADIQIHDALEAYQQGDAQVSTSDPVADNAAQAAVLVGDVAAATARQEKAEIEAYKKELSLLQPLIAQIESALAALEANKRTISREADARIDFQSRVSGELDEMRVNGVGQSPEPRSIQRVCNGPAGVSDRVMVLVDAPQEISVLLGNAEFDQGHSEDVFFRRVANTNEWIASFVWPIASTRATFAVKWPGARSRVQVPGTITADRESVDQATRSAEEALKTILRRYEKLRYLSHGGETLSNVPIP